MVIRLFDGGPYFIIPYYFFFSVWMLFLQMNWKPLTTVGYSTALYIFPKINAWKQNKTKQIKLIERLVWLFRDQVPSVLLANYFNLIKKYQVLITHIHGDKNDFNKPLKNHTSSLYSI